MSVDGLFTSGAARSMLPFVAPFPFSLLENIVPLAILVGLLNGALCFLSSISNSFSLLSFSRSTLLLFVLIGPAGLALETHRRELMRRGECLISDWLERRALRSGILLNINPLMLSDLFCATESRRLLSA